MTQQSYKALTRLQFEILSALEHQPARRVVDVVSIINAYRVEASLPEIIQGHLGYPLRILTRLNLLYREKKSNKYATYSLTGLGLNTLEANKRALEME